MTETYQTPAPLLDRRMNRRTLMTGTGRTLITAGAVTLVAGAPAAMAQALPGAATAAEDPGASAARASLEGMMDAYLDALVAGDPALAPFTADAIFAENDQALLPGDGTWRTIDRLGRYRHYFAEPENDLVGVLANAYENGTGCILIVTLKIAEQKIAWAEQFVIRDPNGARLYEELGQPDPVWLESIPPEQRQSREALEAAAWIYFQSLQRNDGAGVYPFRDDCERIEHARRTVSQPKVEGYGHADTAVDFVTLKAKAQYELGMMAFVTRIRDRRASVVDIERGVVLGQSGWDFDGTLQTIHFKDRDWEIPPYFRTPRTHQVTEAFKVINGSFRYIEMTLMEVPFGTRQVIPGRPMTVRLDYASTRPAPQPVRTKTRADLNKLTNDVLDAMIRCCPCDLPFADRARYTENGVTVTPGEGLWKSLVGLRDYSIFLADPATGQAGWFGALDEYGLFAMLALRFRTEAGLITELEAIIARPEIEAAVSRRTSPDQEIELKGATFSMFVPPLLADLKPEGFSQLPAVLLKRPGRMSRPDLTGAVDRYFEAFTRKDATLAPLAEACARRENGSAANGNPEGPQIDPARPDYRLLARDCAGELDAGFLAGLTQVRERRSLLVDVEQGLVLDLALLDNQGAAATIEINGAGRLTVPGSCRSPWTDMHAQLFKIDDSRIVHIEDLVRRVPYGQGSGWKA